MITVHLPVMLPVHTTPVDIPREQQIAALVSLGLLYTGSGSAYIAGILLKEIGSFKFIVFYLRFLFKFLVRYMLFEYLLNTYLFENIVAVLEKEDIETKTISCFFLSHKKLYFTLFCLY